MVGGTGSADPTRYRRGLQVSRVAGYEALGHDGFWGTAARHVPEMGIIIAGAVTEQEAMETLLQLVTDLIAEIEDSRSGL